MDHSLQKFSSSKDAPAAFPIWESNLSGHLGVGRQRLFELRESALVLGVDWIKKGRRVCLSLEAVRKLEVELGVETNTPGQEPTVLAQVFTFKVHPKLITHPNMILATDGTNIYRVRVKTKANFLRGMEIRCQHDRLDLYDHVGNCPRFRGKY